MTRGKKSTRRGALRRAPERKPCQACSAALRSWVQSKAGNKLVFVQWASIRKNKGSRLARMTRLSDDEEPAGAVAMHSRGGRNGAGRKDQEGCWISKSRERASAAKRASRPAGSLKASCIQSSLTSFRS